MLLSFPPPVIPISVCDASPGPLTTHPIIDKVIGSFMCDSLSSSIFTVSITSNPCLAQDGQDIILTPLFLKPIDFKISKLDSMFKKKIQKLKKNLKNLRYWILVNIKKAMNLA